MSNKRSAEEYNNLTAKAKEIAQEVHENRKAEKKYQDKLMQELSILEFPGKVKNLIKGIVIVVGLILAAAIFYIDGSPLSTHSYKEWRVSHDAKKIDQASELLQQERLEIFLECRDSKTAAQGIVGTPPSDSSPQARLMGTTWSETDRPAVMAISGECQRVSIDSVKANLEKMHQTITNRTWVTQYPVYLTEYFITGE